MKLPELNDNLNVIQALPNKPTLGAEDLKAEFDRGTNLIKKYLNEILLEAIEKLIDDTVDEAKTIVENTLTSESTVNALSSAQGKNLKELIDTINKKLSYIAEGATKDIVENVLTSTSKTNALSALQGKVLKDLVDTKQNTITRGTSSPTGGNAGDIYIQYF